MESRIQIDQVEPKAYQPLMALEQYIAKGSISPSHTNLIKIRASQINGCAYCINMHTAEALKNQETMQRIFLLDAWKHCDAFNEEEKIILQITEEVTLIHQHGLSTETYQKAIEVFDESYLVQVIMTICAINTWNRIAISTLKPI